MVWVGAAGAALPLARMSLSISANITAPSVSHLFLLCAGKTGMAKDLAARFKLRLLDPESIVAEAIAAAGEWERAEATREAEVGLWHHMIRYSYQRYALVVLHPNGARVACMALA